MSAAFVFPALGDSVTQGTVTRWLRQVGESVAEGEPLVEIATDKVDTEVTAPFTGTLAEILVQENVTAEVGQVLATFVTAAAGDAPSADDPDADEPAPPPRVVADAPVAHPPHSGGQTTTAVEIDVTRVLDRADHAVDFAGVRAGSVVSAIADAQVRMRSDATFAAGLSTATITDAGGHGAVFAIPALAAGQVAAVGVGAVVRRVVPVGDGDAIGIRSFAHVCLTSGDESIEPTEAARYLSEVRRILESGALS